MLLWMRPAPVVPAVAAAPAAKFVEPIRASTVQTPPVQAVQVRKRAARPVHRQEKEVALNFFRLPDIDGLPPVESSTIVRVQLPMSSLRLMGLSVSEDQAAESVQADLLLGQDGIARGVRFVE